MSRFSCLLLGLLAGCSIDRVGLAVFDAGPDARPGGEDGGRDTGVERDVGPPPEDGGVDAGPLDAGPPACDPARCEIRPFATATCVDEACVYTCNSLYGDCDMVADNGCETALGSSLTDCGACGM